MNKGCYGGSVRVDKLFFCIKGQSMKYKIRSYIPITYLFNVGVKVSREGR